MSVDSTAVEVKGSEVGKSEHMQTQAKASTRHDLTREVCKALFGTDDVSMVPKPAIAWRAYEAQRAAAYYQQMANRLMVELYCQNPMHKYFDEVKEEDRAALMAERQRRMSEAAKIAG